MEKKLFGLKNQNSIVNCPSEAIKSKLIVSASERTMKIKITDWRTIKQSIVRNPCLGVVGLAISY